MVFRHLLWSTVLVAGSSATATGAPVCTLDSECGEGMQCYRRGHPDAVCMNEGALGAEPAHATGTITPACSVDSDCPAEASHCFRPGHTDSVCMREGALGDTNIKCFTDSECKPEYHCYRPGGTASQCIHNQGLGVGANDFTFKYSDGASFDYSALHTVEGWKLLDDNAIENKSKAGGYEYAYAYYFDVGSDLDRSKWPHLEEACGNTSQYPGKGSGPSVTAPVYQLWKDLSRCEKIGGPVMKEGNMQVYIADALDRPDEPVAQLDPSKGLALVYSGGDPCGTVANRSLTLFVRCEDDDTPVPEHEPVEESQMEQCHYSINIPSIHGCPVECHSQNAFGHRICSGHGNCAYDWDAEKAGCACDEGFYGEQCMDTCTGGCGAHGHCNYNKDTKRAQCFCNNGWEGAACAATTEKSSGGHGAYAFAWALVVILAVLLMGLYAYHRSQLKLTFLPACCGGGATATRNYDDFIDDSGYTPPMTQA